LTSAQKKHVNAMLKFSKLAVNVERMDYDIPRGKAKLKRRVNFKRAKTVGSSQPTLIVLLLRIKP
jgi:hypothetical protein